jgi:hypothetical protein
MMCMCGLDGFFTLEVAELFALRETSLLMFGELRVHVCTVDETSFLFTFLTFWGLISDNGMVCPSAPQNQLSSKCGF